LLENAGVAITPGIDFGRHKATRHVRFAYTTSMQQLQLGVERIAAYLGR
ncbi:MAG: aminotransferase, partial [Thiogranum sp.]